MITGHTTNVHNLTAHTQGFEWIVFSLVSKDTDVCIKPRQYQMSLTTSTSGP